MSQIENVMVRRGHPAWWAVLRYSQLGFRFALAALGLLAMAVATYFVFEWAYPPQPVNYGLPLLFFNDDGRRAPRFLNKSFSYAAYILLLAAFLKASAALACTWVEERIGWKLGAAVSLFLLSGVLHFVGNASCGCS